MVVFWDVALHSLVEVYDVSDRSDDGGSKYLWKIGRLHGATSQKTVIFILAAVRT
jgi:hypothetical protein